jgi:PAS domain S-box-containing protein
VHSSFQPLRSSRLRGARSLLRAAGSAAVIAALLSASLRFPYIDHATIALLLLSAVVAVGVYWGTLQALVSAFVGGAGFAYFYLPPHGLGIDKPEHWVALAIFIFVAASVGHLASRLKYLLDKRTSLMQLSLEPLCIIDLGGTLESVNAALVRLLGWPEQIINSRPFLDFVHSDDRARTEEAMRQASNAGSVLEIEIRFQSKEEDWRWLRWRISRTDFAESSLIAAARDITEEKLAQEKLRALADQVIIAQEDERRRISRELHDDVTQRLAALGIEMGLLKRSDALHDSVVEQELTRLQDEVLGLSEDIRQLSHSLHPSVLEHSTLTAALESYCREFSRQTGIATAFTHRDVPAEIPQSVAIAFYRIAQEALRNVALHSGATKSSVVLSGENLTLNVIDNGRGFDPTRAIKSKGLGLVSMEERARLAGAVVSIESVPGEGTTVSAQIPPKVQVPS